MKRERRNRDTARGDFSIYTTTENGVCCECYVLRPSDVDPVGIKTGVCLHVSLASLIPRYLLQMHDDVAHITGKMKDKANITTWREISQENRRWHHYQSADVREGCDNIDK